MLVHKITSWSQWKEMIPRLGDELPFGSAEDGHISDLLFRGHRCCSWELESTLERKGIELPSCDSYAREIKAVKLAFESYLGSSWSSAFSPSELPAPPEDYEFMVYLRHHGYPTPLLDWTRSPYIASFFAFQYPSEEESVSIHSFREYAGEAKTGWTGDSNIVGCGPTIRTHRRHYAQQAEYTYCRKKLEGSWYYSSHEKALEETGVRQDILKKYVLPADMRREVLADLDSMSINAYTLFGSEEGLAEMLANREYGYEA
ncbi:MAG: FRG domain-containing protein [Ectothiorhodospiraceae bacterium]|nr:FRG domain-containing protein [Ectothiorhodospiraceae bacterium]